MPKSSLTIFERVALNRVRQIIANENFQHGQGLPKVRHPKRARTTFVNKRHVSAGSRFTGFHHTPNNWKGSTPRATHVAPVAPRSQFQRIPNSFTAQVIPDYTISEVSPYWWAVKGVVEVLPIPTVAKKSPKDSLTSTIASLNWKPAAAPQWAQNDVPKRQTASQAAAILKTLKAGH